MSRVQARARPREGHALTRCGDSECIHGAAEVARASKLASASDHQQGGVNIDVASTRVHQALSQAAPRMVQRKAFHMPLRCSTVPASMPADKRMMALCTRALTPGHKENMLEMHTCWWHISRASSRLPAFSTLRTYNPGSFQGLGRVKAETLGSESTWKLNS